MAKFMPNAKISNTHGQAVWVNGKLVVAMYHPAATNQPSIRPQLEAVARLPEFVHLAKADLHLHSGMNEKPAEPEEKEPPKDQPTQLSLF